MPGTRSAATSLIVAKAGGFHDFEIVEKAVVGLHDSMRHLLARQLPLRRPNDQRTPPGTTSSAACTRQPGTPDSARIRRSRLLMMTAPESDSAMRLAPTE